MAWSEQIFRYCERGADAGFWAEPINAVTNLAFVAAAAIAAGYLVRTPQRSTKTTEAVLVALVFVIGVGSFLFHTFATRLASLADVIPIGLFMIGYLGFALRRFAGWSWTATGLALAGFAASLWGAGAVTCQPDFMPVSNALNVPCFNGTVGYLPALMALFAVGVGLWLGGHAAGGSLVLAGALFAVSMTFRTFDFEVCAKTAISAEHYAGTHFLWHLCNAALLFVLLRAAILYGSPRAVR